MGLLDSLLSGPQQQQDYQDYVQRYQQGPPHEGYSDQEVLQRYQQVAPQLGPQEFRTAAEQAFSNMPPDQRVQYGQYVGQQLQGQGLPMPGFAPGQGNPQLYQDPGYLAQQTAQLHQQQPGLLGQLLGGGGGGGGGGGLLANPAAKAALAGIAAMAISNAMGGRTNSPLGGLLGA
jgi:hypothetical protein